MRIGITGASGFIGRHLVEKLEKEGHEPVVLGRSGQRLERLFSKYRSVSVRQTDYGSGDLLCGLDGCEGVVHLASIRYLDGPESFSGYVANVIISENLFRACRDLGITNLVLASTGSIYNEQRNKLPFRETETVYPAGFYALSKLAAEKLGVIYGLRIKSLRIARVLGWHRPDRFMLMTFIKNALEGRPITVYGTGSGRREYLYVKDAIRAIERALEKPDACGIYNIGSGRNVPADELAVLIADVLGKGKSEIRFDENRDEDRSNFIMDSTKALRELGWKPDFNMRQALVDMKDDREHMSMFLNG